MKSSERWSRSYPRITDPRERGAWLHFQDDLPKEVVVFDALGQRVAASTALASTMHYLDMRDTPKGMYWVRVSCGMHLKVKRLLIQ